MWILVLYALAGVINLTVEYFTCDIARYISKVALMPLLMLYLFQQTKKIKSFKFIYAALFFSWLGDIFLMFPRASYNAQVAQNLFIAGLVSFLIAHVNYIISFLKEINKQNRVSLIVEKPYLVLPFLLYLFLLLCFLFPSLGVMKVPVSIYGVCITLMLIFAFNRKNLVIKKSFYLVFMGAILFILSDSLIAIDVFYQKMEWHRTAIMLTYIIAQYLIIEGVIKAYKSTTKDV